MISTSTLTLIIFEVKLHFLLLIVDQSSVFGNSIHTKDSIEFIHRQHYKISQQFMSPDKDNNTSHTHTHLGGESGSC